MKISKNMIRCKLCGDVIESTYRYDFVMCSCGACAVDGGQGYLRRAARTRDCFEELSLVEKSENIERKITQRDDKHSS